jgi:SAM-dependent methyltransferase
MTTELTSPGPFDRAAVRQRRTRAAATLAEADFLLARVCDDIAERLDEVNRRFARIAVIGAGDGSIAQMLTARYGPDLLVQVDTSAAMARHAARACPPALTLVADEELLPLAAESFDLIVAPLTLHAVNDLPGALIQMRRALRPDGLLIAAMLAGETLAPLRDAFARAEIETVDGLSPRVAPMADLRDLGGLLQRAGLALPVADRDRLTVRYGNPLRLLHDLRAMGEANPLAERRRIFLRRETLLRALAILTEDHADADGKVPIHFDIAYLHGWAPDASQQQPLRPGSAKTRLADALRTTEHPLSDEPNH